MEATWSQSYAAWASAGVGLLQCGIVAYWLRRFQSDLNERERIIEAQGSAWKPWGFRCKTNGKKGTRWPPIKRTR